MEIFRRPLSIGLVLLAGSLALSFAACGGDSSSTPASPTTTTPSTPTGPVVTLAPSTVTFTAAASGDAQSVTLTNSGVAELQITNIVTIGNFDQTNDCGTTVEVGASCTIRVTFTPRVATAPAASSGAIAITDNASTSPQTVSLVGPSVTTATARLSPASVSFGNQRVGTASAAQVVTLSNIVNGAATVALTVHSVEPSGDFSLTRNACGSSLAAGSSCAISVAFTPTAAGARSGTLTVFHNGPLGVVIIPLDGVGQ